MSFKINERERGGLYGLPHIQQLIYLRAIRPFMDYQTGIVGIKRKISYQSLRDEIFVEPHTGYRAETYSREQLRRALEGLVRAGVLDRKSKNKQLIFECSLASRDFSVQNKADTNPTHQADTKQAAFSIAQTDTYKLIHRKADTPETTQADTPPGTGNIVLLLQQRFEKFWSLYPLKKSKQKAWEQFYDLSPDDALWVKIQVAIVEQTDFIKYLKTEGYWVPSWKYPANWLAQHCWDDQLEIPQGKEKPSANHRANHRERRHDPLWESCQSTDDITTQEEHNVIQINRYRQTTQTD